MQTTVSPLEFHRDVKEIAKFLPGKNLDHYTSASIDIDTDGVLTFKAYTPETAWIVGLSLDACLYALRLAVNTYAKSIGEDPPFLTIPGNGVPDDVLVHDIELCPPGEMDIEPDIVMSLPVDPDHLTGNVYQPSL